MIGQLMKADRRRAPSRTMKAMSCFPANCHSSRTTCSLSWRALAARFSRSQVSPRARAQRTPRNWERINDPVRTYLREMGTVSLLTREGEIDLAKRIERGQTRVKKALSRAPLVIQEMLKLGEALEQDRVSVRDVLIMPDSNGIDNSGTEQKEQLLQRIAEIAKHYEKAQQFHQKLQAVSRRLKPKQHRMLRYNFARSVVRLSRIYRQIQFTPQFQRKTHRPDRAGGRAVQTGRAGDREDPAEAGGKRAGRVGRAARRTPRVVAATDAAPPETGKGLGMGRHGTPAHAVRSSSAASRKPRRPRSSSSRQTSGWWCRSPSDTTTAACNFWT